MTDISRTTCDFSCTEPMCKTLDKAGVPTDGKWRSLILYLRDMAEHSHRTDKQKTEFQQLLVKQIETKDFSPQCFKALTYKVEQIICAPCQQRLETAIEETASLLGEFQEVLACRRGDMQTLETTTTTRLESGIEPHMLLSELRSALHSIINTMDEDIDNLHTLSSLDGLTGLPNRRTLDEYLKKEVDQTRHKKNKLSVIFLDIDHFKRFNDDYGHRIGDQALATVASIIKQSLQKFQQEKEVKSFAGRYGGEEFAIIINDSSEETTATFAEFLRQQLQNYNFIIRNQHGKIARNNIQITASLGVSLLQHHWPEPLCEYLLDTADQAMYQAKKAGRNQVYCHNAQS